MALQEDRIRDGIAVIGAGTSGYLTVLYLCKNYPDINIRWVYPQNNKPIGVGEATVPEVTLFLKELGITPKIIINEMNGTLKLGVKFKDFYKDGESYNHPFGGTDWEGFNIDYMIETNTVPDNILDYEEIANHFDVRELMLYLDKLLPTFPNLNIERWEVQSSSDLSEKIVIDCTGFRKSLLNQLIPNNFVSITDKIPNNSAYVYRAPYKSIEQKVPYTISQAMHYGWAWNIPLGDKLTVGYVHDDKHDVYNEYVDYLKTIYGDVDETKINKVGMITGKNKEHIYESNQTVIAIGLSSFFIEPLEATGLYLVQFGIRLFDDYINGKITAEKYNDVYNNEFDTILDFIIAHYKFSTRDNEYWSHYKNLDAELYKENNIFPKRSWDYVLRGFGLSNYKPTMDRSFFAVRQGKKYNEKDFT
jgi:tryptophan halogenase